MKGIVGGVFSAIVIALVVICCFKCNSFTFIIFKLWENI